MTSHSLATRLALAGITGLAAALLLAAPASGAYGNLFAHFNATLKGTYTSTEKVTYSDCVSPESAATFTKTGTVSDQVRFGSVRPQPIEVGLLALPPLLAGGTGRDMKIHLSDDRDGNLTERGVPLGCLLERPDDRPATCGARSVNFDGNVEAALHGIGLGFVFRKNHTIDYPDDIFGQRCQLPQPAYWIGALDFLTGPTTVKALFNQRRRTVVVRAQRSGRKTEGGSTSTSTTTYEEHLTLTLVRVGEHAAR